MPGNRRSARRPSVHIHRCSALKDKWNKSSKGRAVLIDRFLYVELISAVCGAICEERGKQIASR